MPLVFNRGRPAAQAGAVCGTPAALFAPRARGGSRLSPAVWGTENVSGPEMRTRSACCVQREQSSWTGQGPFVWQSLDRQT